MYLHHKLEIPFHSHPLDVHLCFQKTILLRNPVKNLLKDYQEDLMLAFSHPEVIK